MCAPLRSPETLPMALRVAAARWPLFGRELASTLNDMLRRMGYEADIGEDDVYRPESLVEEVARAIGGDEVDDPQERRRIVREATTVIISALVSTLWKMGVNCRG